MINKIYNENCLDTMSRMENDTIDLVVTSPPYDKLRAYNGYDFPFEKIAAELFRVIKQGGVLVWVVGDETVDGSESTTSSEQKIFFRKCGFNIHDTMIYLKNSMGMPDKVRYMQAFEYMFVFSKGKPKTVNIIKDKPNTAERWSKKFKTKEADGTTVQRTRTLEKQEYGARFNVWHYNTGHGMMSEDKIASEHPAIFPEQLAADHIYSWSNEGDLVYDPFGGSGTTVKMAHKQNRNWIMSEISKQYCELAEKRISPYITQSSFF